MEGIISEENRASLSFFDPGRRYRTIVDEEFRAVRPDGEARWLRLRSFPVYDDSGNAIGAAGIFADVTMFKVMGEQQRLHREQLMHADKMASLGVLVSSIAHEINNPNNFLLLNAKIIERTWLEIRPVLDRHAGEVEGFSIANLPYADARERLPKLLEGICEGGERIRRIIETLRMYARKEGENGHGSVCLNEVVNSALTICGHFINKATHELIVEQTPDLPPVQGNFQQLEQVMINLLTNAGQALPSPEKSICVRTYAHTDENRVVMEVQDEGCGIPEEGLEQLTSPFFTTKGASGGTGLGLSISNDIVKRHGGKLVFESKPGRGTTASVVLPCH
jgi:polar amino acid transport system substrate-binding protein